VYDPPSRRLGDEVDDDVNTGIFSIYREKSAEFGQKRKRKRKKLSMRGRDVIWSHYGEKINKVSITNLVPNLVPILLPSEGGSLCICAPLSCYTWPNRTPCPGELIIESQCPPYPKTRQTAKRQRDPVSDRKSKKKKQKRSNQ
jgi:hypothetical protein